ncbi:MULTISPECIES: aminotransferase class I/II-fold pyridoxal phosphate-dependent enzyme [unclassified Listeria]|uniref:aminotransferase class I/II-fold pyridoxal phosphate-dependent enzyme n=1 Tax=unclassified Listeria TaxID=2642072 RepID=UPI000B589C49|nr:MULTISPECIES: aminotransferase class I/II-fold pyridoxal phosphate-dependent enzyme [unclassified Listeria]
MPKNIRPELAAIQISGIRRFNNEIANIEGIMKLTLGEPDFDTPEHVKQAAINAIQDNFTNYTNNAGMPELVSAAADYFNKKYALGFTKEEIIVTIGATEAIAVALETILEPGDEVILPDPIYPGYEPLIKLMDAVPVKVDTTESAFKLTPSQLKRVLSDKTKALILPYPSNPTGVTLTESELRELANVLEGTGIYVVADEIYSELTYDKPHTSMRPMLPEQTIVINGLSKSHAMIGFRIGFLMAPKPLLTEMLKIHQYTVTCASSISQKAALQAVTKGENDALLMRSEYKVRAKFVQDRLVKMGFQVIPPDGAFYFFVKLPDFVTENAYDFALKLAKEAKVAVVPGNAFSEKGDRYFRLSYAASLNKLALATENMAKFMEKNYSI